MINFLLSEKVPLKTRNKYRYLWKTRDLVSIGQMESRGYKRHNRGQITMTFSASSEFIPNLKLKNKNLQCAISHTCKRIIFLHSHFSYSLLESPWEETSNADGFRPFPNLDCIHVHTTAIGLCKEHILSLFYSSIFSTRCVMYQPYDWSITIKFIRLIRLICNLNSFACVIWNGDQMYAIHVQCHSQLVIAASSPVVPWQKSILLWTI